MRRRAVPMPTQQPEQERRDQEAYGPKGSDSRRIAAAMDRLGDLVDHQQHVAELRRRGYDPVVQRPDGSFCWSTELSDAEIEAESATLRTDLLAPPGREHEGPHDDELGPGEPLPPPF